MLSLATSASTARTMCQRTIQPKLLREAQSNSCGLSGRVTIPVPVRRPDFPLHRLDSLMINAVMTYLASCSGSCSKFSGSTGKVWVKIDQGGYDASESVPWASKRLPTQNSTWTVTMPSSIAPGNYLLRYALTRGLPSVPTYTFERKLTAV